MPCTRPANGVWSACWLAWGSPEIVGQYALGVAVSTPILMLAQLNLRTVLATDVKEEHHFLDYRDVRVVSLLLALIGIAAIALFEHSVQDQLAVVLVALAQSVEWVADIYIGLFQRHEHMKRIAITLSLHGIFSVVILSAVVAITGSLSAGLAGVLVVRLLALFLYDSTYATRGCLSPRDAQAEPLRPTRVQRTRDRQDCFPAGSGVDDRLLLV